MGKRLDTQRMNEDATRVSEIIERGDRLMYQADNFADRTEFTDARHANERIEERMRRLIAYFQATAPQVEKISNHKLRLVGDVAETFDPEWDVERDKAGDVVVA